MMKKHKPRIGDYVMAECYKAELAKVKKQLEVAVATLELYALEKMYLRDTKTGYEFEFDNIGYSRAKEALKHIKELDNA